MELLAPLACLAFGIAANGGPGRVTPPLPGMPRWIALGGIASACGAQGKAASDMPAQPLGRSRPWFLRSWRSSAGQLFRILSGAVSSRSR
jgi:hypothetical protein